MSRTVLSVVTNIARSANSSSYPWLPLLSRVPECDCSITRRTRSSRSQSQLERRAAAAVEETPPNRRSLGHPDSISFFEKLGDSSRNPFNPALFPEEIRYGDPLEGLQPTEKQIANDIVSRVNEKIAAQDYGRLFAVIHVIGRQFRVTDEDIICIHGTYHLGVGEKIRFEKILACGGKDFTLLGRPILDRGLVNVEATCIEKSLSYPVIKMIHFHRIPRRIRRFDRIAETFIRINRVSLTRPLNQKVDPESIVYDLR